jgi:hypothetical protein
MIKKGGFEYATFLDNRKQGLAALTDNKNKIKKFSPKHLKNLKPVVTIIFLA